MEGVEACDRRHVSKHLFITRKVDAERFTAARSLNLLAVKSLALAETELQLARGVMWQCCPVQVALLPIF